MYNEIQTKIFEQVRSQIHHKKWIEEIASVIGRSKNSVYKKLSGEIGLSLEELAMLSKHYQIYLDPIVQPQRNVTFEFPFLEEAQAGSKQFFHSLSGIAQTFKTLPGLRVWISQMEIPFLHDYNFPEITAFKFFTHNKTIWKSPERIPHKFSLERWMSDGNFRSTLKELLQIYYNIPSVEFWHSLILDITLSQIKYTVEVGLFEDPLDAVILCEKLSDFVNHMQYMADLGIKVPFDENIKIQKEAEFVLYHNEIAHSNNIFHLESEGRDIVFISFGNPNFMYSSVPTVVDYSKNWFQLLRENSQLITKESRKSRLSFFNELRRKIDNTSIEINAMLKVQRL